MIHVFVRHGDVSENSKMKPRPPWFTMERALQNLIDTSDAKTAITLLVDTASSSSSNNRELKRAGKCS